MLFAFEQQAREAVSGDENMTRDLTESHARRRQGV